MSFDLTSKLMKTERIEDYAHFTETDHIFEASQRLMEAENEELRRKAEYEAAAARYEAAIAKTNECHWNKAEAVILHELEDV